MNEAGACAQRWSDPPLPYTARMDDANPRAETPDDSDASPEQEETPAIRLDDVLKLAGIAATGGQAKHMIQSGEVKVNGVIETRRKHLLHEGDEVAVGDETFVVELAGEEGDAGEQGGSDA